MASSVPYDPYIPQQEESSQSRTAAIQAVSIFQFPTWFPLILEAEVGLLRPLFPSTFPNPIWVEADPQTMVSESCLTDQDLVLVCLISQLNANQI